MRFKFAKRIIVIGWNTANILSGAIFSVLLSIEVIRLCSKDLWGSMVEVLLWFGLASHILYFGNGNLLLREFSLTPQNISTNWAKSLQARTLLFLLACLLLFFLPMELKLKFFLFVFLSANFLYRSYDVVILFKRQFMISMLLEAGGFLIIASYVFINRKTMSINRLVGIYSIAEVCKTITMFLLFIKEIRLPSLKFNTFYFSLALPFFLLEFTGLLQSKTDLICVTWFLSKDKIAQYQIYINFLLLVQSTVGFILAPFIKNIYRMKSESIQKISLKFFCFGIILALVSTFFIHFFINYFYHFTIPAFTLIMGAFFIMPIFYYTTIVYRLLKFNKQKSVVLLNVVGIIISFVLNIILIPRYPDGISGAIIAIAITQWVVLFIYLGVQKKLTSAILTVEVRFSS